MAALSGRMPGEGLSFWIMSFGTAPLEEWLARQIGFAPWRMPGEGISFGMMSVYNIRSILEPPSGRMLGHVPVLKLMIQKEHPSPVILRIPRQSFFRRVHLRFVSIFVILKDNPSPVILPKGAPPINNYFKDIPASHSLRGAVLVALESHELKG